MTQNEPIFFVSTSPNSTEITKLILNNNTSICLCIVFAMTSKVRKKRNNFKINRKGGRFSKNTKKRKIFSFIGRLGRSAVSWPHSVCIDLLTNGHYNFTRCMCCISDEILEVMTLNCPTRLLELNSSLYES